MIILIYGDYGDINLKSAKDVTSNIVLNMLFCFIADILRYMLYVVVLFKVITDVLSYISPRFVDTTEFTLMDITPIIVYTCLVVTFVTSSEG